MDRVDHFGRDLYVVLDRARGPSLRVHLEEQLRDGVRSGRLHAGTALPSTRALASELGVARGVVVAAYSQLVAEGFLVARRGAATRVARVARDSDLRYGTWAGAPALRAALAAYVGRARGVVAGELAAAVRD